MNADTFLNFIGTTDDFTFRALLGDGEARRADYQMHWAACGGTCEMCRHWSDAVRLFTAPREPWLSKIEFPVMPSA